MYRHLIQCSLALLFLLESPLALAVLNMELNQGTAGTIPIAIVPFTLKGSPPTEKISHIIAQDLYSSGRFKVYSEKEIMTFPKNAQEIESPYFKHLGIENVLIGQIHELKSQHNQIKFQLLDIFERKNQRSPLISQRITVAKTSLRMAAHHISDVIYQKLLGIPGVFSTKIAYVLIQRIANQPTHYQLEIADSDGHNPQRLLDSTDPIMSPAWSPNGKQLAYVSFEKRRSAIYIQEVETGNRQLLSAFTGINGAPAWSPDGKKIALVLSQSGSPNIYVITLATRKLIPITQDGYINTEPVWAADGQSLLFTSNRSGGPQIYRIAWIVPPQKSPITRITYEGDYNARASLTYDGQSIAFIHREAGIYQIARLNLQTGSMCILSHNKNDSLSPSIAPNGSMVLYDRLDDRHNILAMVSSDGKTETRLPIRSGEVQDPAWSPFLS